MFYGPSKIITIEIWINRLSTLKMTIYDNAGLEMSIPKTKVITIHPDKHVSCKEADSADINFRHNCDTYGQASPYSEADL